MIMDNNVNGYEHFEQGVLTRLFSTCVVAKDPKLSPSLQGALSFRVFGTKLHPAIPTCACGFGLLP